MNGIYPMNSFLRFAVLLVTAAVFSGCGGTDKYNLGDFASLTTRGYLVKEGAFSESAITNAVEVISSGTPSYSVRFLLEKPLSEGEKIEVLAGPPAFPEFRKIFVLTSKDLKPGENSDYWATLNTTQVESPLVPSPLLTTQIRTAAENGKWQFRRTGNDELAASGTLLPNKDASLSVFVPDTAEGLGQGNHPFGSIKPRGEGITIQSSLPISNAAVFGKLQRAALVVQETDSNSKTLLEAPLNFVVSPSHITLTSSLPLTASDLSPAYDTDIKYLIAGIQHGFGFLRLNVVRSGNPEVIYLKVGIQR